MSPERNAELADFLRRARSRVDPLRSGLPADGRVRRVPGLRREEVARLAGVSTDYYTRLEQGRPIAPSPGVVDAVARALDLDATGRAHLRHLLGAAGVAGRRTAPPTVARVRPGLHQLIDSLELQPALVLGFRGEVLASNRLARAVFTDFDSIPAPERSYVRWILLDPSARTLFRDWEEARVAVESLRLASGAHPDDRGLGELVALLEERSPEFRRWWSEHAVFQRTHGRKRLRHPVAGDLDLDYETMLLPDDADQTVFWFFAEPGPSQDALRLLASWAQTAVTEAP